MNLLAELHYLIGSIKRKRGHYNLNTLKHLKKAYSLSGKIQHFITYTYLARDIKGEIPKIASKKLKALLHKKMTTNQRKRLIGLVTETSNIKSKPKKNIALESKTYTLDNFFDWQDQWRIDLNKFLIEKTIAVIGNSALIMDTDQGSIIDNFDIVCRFNRYAKSPRHQADAGERIDIWIASAEVLNEQPIVPTSLKWIILTGADARYTLLSHESCRDYLKQGIKIVTLPVNIWSKLVRELESPPSAGLLWLSYLYEESNLQLPIKTFGFDSAQNLPKQYHAGSEKFTPSKRHAWKKEKKALNTLAKKRFILPVTPKSYAVYTKGLAKNTCLGKHLKSKNITYKPSAKCNVDFVLGWGKKANTKQARAYAIGKKIPYLALEDGFIHSMSQGRLGADSWSLVIDEKGIFYDATQTSDLEELISTIQLTSEELARAKTCIDTITKHNITKYNNSPLNLPTRFKDFKDAVLVLDQVEGDMSIPSSMASAKSFDLMLKAAIEENPKSDILIKRHPDVINGKRKGCITLSPALPINIHLISDNLNPLVLMKQVSKVYVVSSQAGFEALLLGKEVICFGAPFYAGWGLTSDRFNKTLDVVKRRTRLPDLYTIFFCAYISYSRYLDPITKRPCEIEAVLDHVRQQYIHYQQNSGYFICLGLTPWKRRFISHFLKSTDNHIHYINNITESKKLEIDKDTKILIWSNRHEDLATDIASKTGGSILKVEDGFLRSAGLGANYSLPSSIIFDNEGIYFDPSKPSKLENVLNYCQFNSKKLKRAKKLRKKIISLGISKYNIGEPKKSSPPINTKNKKIILVPGQVSDDASIKLGCKDISTNIDLLKATRQANPSAYIIYKPHPDVISDNRAGALAEVDVLKHCDKIEKTQSISNCLAFTDEVHTMTSLVGFEALIRGITVYCYGLPFYSNWGLTQDRHLLDRRKRVLTVDELIAGTLIDYPTYFDWTSNSFTSAEHIAGKLYVQSKGISQKNNQSILTKKISKYLNLLRALLVR